jgi:4-amino-4-deoxy-L-arabinose transferase-like glycosyltransferase
MHYFNRFISIVKENDKLLLILLLGFILRLWGLQGSLPLNYADEEVYVVGALRMGQGDLNPHSFYNPSLMIYFNFIIFGCYYLIGKLLFIFSSLNDFKNLFYGNPSSFYLLARLFMVLFGILSIVVLYKLVRSLYDENKALISALLLALYPGHIYASQSAKCDVAMVFLVLLSIFYLIRYFKENHNSFFYLGCFLCGLAISTKYTAAPLFASCLLTYLIKIKFYPSKRDVFSVSVGLSLILAGFLIATPFSILDYPTFYADIRDLSGRNAMKWFGMEGAHVGLWEYTLTVFPRSSGWTIYACFLLGTIYFIRHFKLQELIIFSFPALLFISLAQTNHVGWNYALPLYPFFCIMASFLIAGFLFYIKRRTVKIILMMLIIVPPLVMGIVNGHNKSTIDTRFLAKDWIEKHVATDKKIAAESYFDTLIPNSKRAQEILTKINDQKRGGQFKYYLEQVYEKSYYIFTFPLFSCAFDDQERTDENQRRCTKPNLSDYDFGKVRSKFDYMVLSSYVYSRFEAFPQLYPTQNEFYHQLKSQGNLLQVFGNYNHAINDGLSVKRLFQYIGFVDHQGPIIKIFKL